MFQFPFFLLMWNMIERDCCYMGLTPNIVEILARARADLRMGVPIVLAGPVSVMALSAETLSSDRLTAAMAIDGAPVLALTSWRAQTLKARAYDEDIARVKIPGDASLTWIQALADPADDLATPMKGPLTSIRDGDADVPCATPFDRAKLAQPCRTSTIAYGSVRSRPLTRFSPGRRT